MSSPYERFETSPWHEIPFRRPGYLGGRPIRLADGREWFFPGLGELESAGPDLRAEVKGLLTAISESEDEAERRRGELALGIRLLAANYDLSPADFSRLLSYPSGDPGLAGLQAGFRDLSRRHGEAQRPAPEAPRPSRRRRFHLPTLSCRRPLHSSRLR